MLCSLRQVGRKPFYLHIPLVGGVEGGVQLLEENGVGYGTQVGKSIEIHKIKLSRGAHLLHFLLTRQPMRGRSPPSLCPEIGMQRPLGSRGRSG
jgi:hypothetical protein